MNQVGLIRQGTGGVREEKARAEHSYSLTIYRELASTLSYLPLITS